MKNYFIMLLVTSLSLSTFVLGTEYRGTRFVDTDHTSYLVDPNGHSVLSTVSVVGNLKNRYGPFVTVENPLRIQDKILFARDWWGDEIRVDAGGWEYHSGGNHDFYLDTNNNAGESNSLIVYNHGLAGTVNELFKVRGNGSVLVAGANEISGYKMVVNGHIYGMGLRVLNQATFDSLVKINSGRVVLGTNEHNAHSAHLTYNRSNQTLDIISSGHTTTSYGNIRFMTGNNDRFEQMRINNQGNVMIGSTTPASLGGQTAKLTVKGLIAATDLKIRPTSAFPDYVFEDDYALMPLNELKDSISEHKHLPGIPSAKDVETEGLSIGEMQIKLLEKVEELTLYIIEQEEKIQALEAKIEKPLLLSSM